MFAVYRSPDGARRFALWIGAFSALVVACGSGEAGAPQVTHCKVDSDCSSDEICGGSTCQPLSSLGAAGSSNTNMNMTGSGGRRADSCGNGVKEGSEACDRQDLNGESCGSLTSGASSGSLACDSNCNFDLRGCSSSNGSGGNQGGGGDFGTGGEPFGSGGYFPGSGGFSQGTGGGSGCDTLTYWLVSCTGDFDCGGCGLTCISTCSACTAKCAHACRTDADCAGQYIDTLATPYCFVNDAAYSGRCSSSP